MVRLRVVALTLLAQGADLMKTVYGLFVKQIIVESAGEKDRMTVDAFLASDEYLKHVLPSFLHIEEQLLHQWRRFSAQGDSPLPLQDFSGPSPLPANNAGLGDAVSLAHVTTGTEVQRPREPQSQVSEAPIAPSTAAGSAISPTPALGNVTSAKPPPAPPTTSSVPPPIGRPSAAPERTAPSPQGAKTMALRFEFALPNASVGQAYSHVLRPTKPVPGLVVTEVRVPDGIGLRFESSTCQLLGTPTKPGEFQLDIRFRSGNHPLDLVSARLTVNPDPKSLWKNLPSNESDPYWKPDEAQQFIEGSHGWNLVAGSKRGRSHAQNGTFRDDDFFIYSQAQSGWQIAVVSDGAGSAKFSRRGSAIICKEGGEHLEHALAGEAGDKLTEAVEALQVHQPGGQDADQAKRLIKNQLYVTLGYAAHHALTRIREECEGRADLGGVIKDYSSTVLIGIAKRFSSGTFCASFNIGDGAIGVMHLDGNPELLCEPDGGDFSGQTRFLSPETVTQEELLKRVKFSFVADFSGLYLMTDGISDPYFQTDKGLEMPERWATLIQDLNAEASLTQRDADSGRRLVAWLDFWSKGEHDDRTLAVIF